MCRGSTQPAAKVPHMPLLQVSPQQFRASFVLGRDKKTKKNSHGHSRATVSHACCPEQEACTLEIERPEPDLRKGTYRTGRRTRRTPRRTLQNTQGQPLSPACTDRSIPMERSRAPPLRRGPRKRQSVRTTKGTSFGKELIQK